MKNESFSVCNTTLFALYCFAGCFVPDKERYRERGKNLLACVQAARVARAARESGAMHPALFLDRWLNCASLVCHWRQVSAAKLSRPRIGCYAPYTPSACLSPHKGNRALQERNNSSWENILFRQKNMKHEKASRSIFSGEKNCKKDIFFSKKKSVYP